jgi:hypothetical protein
MLTIPTPNPLTTIEAALKTPAFWPVFAALEHYASHDPATIRAIGGREFEALISDLSQARHERWRRERRERRKHWPVVRRDDER